VGSGIVGGAAVSAVAWGIHLQKVADHARRLHRLENSKAEKDQVETLKQLLQELRDDVKWLVREKRGE
jgi:biopolymer transport protein ExbB/TolQ